MQFPRNGLAFVVMPFDPQFDDLYKLGIKSVLEADSFRCERVDEQDFFTEDVLQRIIGQIKESNIIIAIMTNRSANVFYEVGFAHALEKTTILLTSKDTDIPFNLKHHPHIIYNSIIDLKEKLDKKVKSAVKFFEDEYNTVSFNLSSRVGKLILSKFDMTAEIDLTFDLYNTTEIRSPDIKSVYLYTQKGWSFTMLEKPCAHVSANMPGYALRHMLATPLQFLEKDGGWSQVSIVGRKVVRQKINGDKMEKSFHLSEEALLRVRAASREWEFSVDLSQHIHC